MRPEHKMNISRGVSITLRRTWEQVIPCPKCGRRVYGNYAGRECKKCHQETTRSG